MTNFIDQEANEKAEEIDAKVNESAEFRSSVHGTRYNYIYETK